MPCRMFRSIPGLYSLNAGSTYQLLKPELSPDMAKCPVRGESKITPQQEPLPMIHNSQNNAVMCKLLLSFL